MTYPYCKQLSFITSLHVEPCGPVRAGVRLICRATALLGKFHPRLVQGSSRYLWWSERKDSEAGRRIPDSGCRNTVKEGHLAGLPSASVGVGASTCVGAGLCFVIPGVAIEGGKVQWIPHAHTRQAYLYQDATS